MTQEAPQDEVWFPFAKRTHHKYVDFVSARVFVPALGDVVLSLGDVVSVSNTEDHICVVTNIYQYPSRGRRIQFVDFTEDPPQSCDAGPTMIARRVGSVEGEMRAKFVAFLVENEQRKELEAFEKWPTLDEAGKDAFRRRMVAEELEECRIAAGEEAKEIAAKICSRQPEELERPAPESQQPEEKRERTLPIAGRHRLRKAREEDEGEEGCESSERKQQPSRDAKRKVPDLSQFIASDDEGDDEEEPSRKKTKKPTTRMELRNKSGQMGSYVEISSSDDGGDDGERVSEKRERLRGGQKVNYAEAGSDEEFSKKVDRNMDMCWICSAKGDLICCDECSKAYHLKCLVPPLGAVPQGAWRCPVCEGRTVNRLPKCRRCRKICQADSATVKCAGCENVTNHVACLPRLAALALEKAGKGAPWYCAACQPTSCSKCEQLCEGESLRCSVCHQSFHGACVGAEGQPKKLRWGCPFCRTGKKVEKIIGYRPAKSDTRSPHSKIAPDLPQTVASVASSALPAPAAAATMPADQPAPASDALALTEFFVKFADLSHLHDEWVPEKWLSGVSPVLLFNYRAKHRHDGPGAGEDFAEAVAEWRQVDRVLACSTVGGGDKYYVKWQGLGYDEATWEDAENLTEFATEIRQYVRANDYEQVLARPAPLPPSPADFSELKAQPSYIPLELFPYQLDGCSWLLFSWHKKRSVILADEMGLGKTITCIAFLSMLSHERRIPGPFLIVVPLSTVTNWEREFKLWGPHFNVVTYVGSAKSREIIQRTEFFFDSEGAGQQPKFNVLLTSFEIALADCYALKKFAWQALIIDEGHRLKNRRSKLFELLLPLRTGWRMLLTGTPLQNDLQELFNMFKFLQIEGFEDPEKLFETEYASLAEQDVIKRLHDVLRPYMLRRLKGDVFKNLPEKSEYLVQVDLAPLQKQTYRAVLMKNYEFLRFGGTSRSLRLLEVFSMLQKVCNHPYLVPGAEPTGLTRDEEFKRLAEASGKLNLVDKMLGKLREQGHRVLLFSQQTRMLDIIEDLVAYRQWAYTRIDGNTKSSDRQERIDLFNQDNSPLFLFLMSTRACRLGINLATADTVIIYDNDWNPHNDVQALSRAHRIGQKKKVMVYQLVTRHTVEEKIVERARSKLLLEHLVVQKMKDEFKKGELDELLRYGTKQLFKEEGDPESVPPLRYVEAEVEKLLDRSRTDDERAAQAKKREADEAQAAAADDKYFGGFKVAKVWAAVEGQSMAVEEEGTAKVSSDRFWDELLKARWDEVQRQRQKELEGPRKRKPIKYHLDEEEEEDPLDDRQDEDFVVEIDPPAPSSARRSSSVDHQSQEQPTPPSPAIQQRWDGEEEEEYDDGLFEKPDRFELLESRQQDSHEDPLNRTLEMPKKKKKVAPPRAQSLDLVEEKEEKSKKKREKVEHPEHRRPSGPALVQNLANEERMRKRCVGLTARIATDQGKRPPGSPIKGRGEEESAPSSAAGFGRPFKRLGSPLVYTVPSPPHKASEDAEDDCVIIELNPTADHEKRRKNKRPPLPVPVAAAAAPPPKSTSKKKHTPTQPEAISNRWSVLQNQLLEEQYMLSDPFCGDFWYHVARGIPGKTADECFSHWNELHPTLKISDDEEGL